MDRRIDIERSLIALEDDHADLLRDLGQARDDLETVSLEKAELEADIVRLTGIIRRLVETRNAIRQDPENMTIRWDMTAAWCAAEQAAR